MLVATQRRHHAVLGSCHEQQAGQEIVHKALRSLPPTRGHMLRRGRQFGSFLHDFARLGICWSRRRMGAGQGLWA